jgi:hypothetical protein
MPSLTEKFPLLDSLSEYHSFIADVHAKETEEGITMISFVNG